MDDVRVDESPLPERAVVLGGGGFIGRAICSAFSTAGLQVIAPRSSDLDLTADDASISLEDILLEGDALVVLSAITRSHGQLPDATFKNLRMAEAICRAAVRRRPAHSIYMSTDGVYGFESGRIVETTPPVAPDLYGASHLMREAMFTHGNIGGVSVLRAPAVYGVGDTHGAYGPNRFVAQALNDGVITLFGNGEECRDHLAVDDLANVVLTCLSARYDGILNVATGRSLSFLRVAEMVAELVGDDVWIDRQPRERPIAHRHFDVSLRLKLFPTLCFTPLEQGLSSMIEASRV